MTKLEKMRETLALEYQNHGCVKGALVFENARTRWAAKDFEAGFNASTAYHAEIIQELVKALEFYTKESNFEKTVWEDDDRSGPCEPYDFEDGELLERHPDGVLSDFGLLAEAALESVRSKI